MAMWVFLCLDVGDFVCGCSCVCWCSYVFVCVCLFDFVCFWARVGAYFYAWAFALVRVCFVCCVCAAGVFAVLWFAVICARVLYVFMCLGGCMCMNDAFDCVLCFCFFGVWPLCLWCVGVCRGVLFIYVRRYCVRYARFAVASSSYTIIAIPLCLLIYEYIIIHTFCSNIFPAVFRYKNDMPLASDQIFEK